MNEREGVKGVCRTCLYYDAYYVQYGSSFAKLDYGFCSRSCEQLQSERDTCINWSPQAQIGGQRRKVVQTREKAQAAINLLKQILCDEEDVR